MDINILKTFIAVCEYTGFSAAAEKLGYTQSTVSSQIRQLEKELNTVLFDRMYHKIGLTSDGIIALKYAKEILESHEQMLSEIKEPHGIKGDIRLAMSSSVSNRYFRSDFLRFRELYPDICYVVTETGTEQMFDMLKKNEVDLLFTLDNHIYDREFEICAERQEKVHFIAAADNPLVKRSEITLEEICSQPLVLTEKEMSYRKILDTVMAEKSLAVHPVLEIGNPLQICSIVRKSEMLSFLPDFISEEYVRAGKVAYLPVKDCDFSVWTQLLVHKNKWKSPALNVFIDYYRDIVGRVSAEM